MLLVLVDLHKYFLVGVLFAVELVDTGLAAVMRFVRVVAVVQMVSLMWNPVFDNRLQDLADLGDIDFAVYSYRMVLDRHDLLEVDNL